jgi:hypothetical protein
MTPFGIAQLHGFLENNFMSNFLSEAELFWKNCLVKQLHGLLHAWMRGINEGES